MKAYKVTWQTFSMSVGPLGLSTNSVTISNKNEYFITQEAALKFIEIKDNAIRELALNMGQIQMPCLYEVELK